MLSGDELLKRGQELYNNGIREAVETDENIGKLVTINVDDNKFIVSDDDLASRVAFRNAYPGANILTLRIGYNAVVSFGGLLERTAK